MIFQVVVLQFTTIHLYLSTTFYYNQNHFRGFIEAVCAYIVYVRTIRMCTVCNVSFLTSLFAETLHMLVIQSENLAEARKVVVVSATKHHTRILVVAVISGMIPKKVMMD